MPPIAALARVVMGLIAYSFWYPVPATKTRYVLVPGPDWEQSPRDAVIGLELKPRASVGQDQVPKGSMMKSKSINDGVERTFVLILDQAEEAFATITDFANREKISGASVSAIGAFSKARVGWFDLSARKYKPIDVSEQCEVLSLIGDVAQGDDGSASLHLHAVLGVQDGTVRGGHFLSGSVQPTLEVTITESVVHLRRKKRADLGIALISI
jgi:uncharacterized protein